MENYKSNKAEDDKCALHGICSISPILSSMQEVILIYLDALAFYLLELGALGVNNEKIKRDVIEIFSGLLSNVEYSPESLNKVISTLYENLFQAKELYKELCTRNNITPNFLKLPIKISKQFNVTEVIKQGQKAFAKKNQLFDENQKKMIDLLRIVLKSICIYIVGLQGLNVNIDEDYKALLSALSIMNFDAFSTQKLDEILDEFVKLDYKLMKDTYESRITEFGENVGTEVSFSIRPGKAILVSGAHLKELEQLLIATQDKGIDVYTHGQMISAHTFPKFKMYPHLVGNYGKGTESYLSDFASFPGAIYLTKLSLYQIGGLYSSRIYTSDNIVPKGVITIKNNDFEPLIKSALWAEGFTETVQNESVKVGFNEEEFFQKIEEVAERMKKNEIKHLFTIGVADKTEAQKEYFKEFLNELGPDSFVFSFSYTNNRDNVMLLNIDYGFPVLYKVMEIFSKAKSLTDLRPTVFYTRCEPHTISNLIYMKKLGIENIYFGNCSPTLVNPAVVELLIEKFNLKRYTSPREDLRNILAQ